MNIWTSDGHLSYKKNVVKPQYPPAVCRVESIRAMPIAVREIRWVMEDDLETVLAESIESVRLIR